MHLLCRENTASHRLICEGRPLPGNLSNPKCGGFRGDGMMGGSGVGPETTLVVQWPALMRFSDPKKKGELGALITLSEGPTGRSLRGEPMPLERRRAAGKPPEDGQARDVQRDGPGLAPRRDGAQRRLRAWYVGRGSRWEPRGMAAPHPPGRRLSSHKMI